RVMKQYGGVQADDDSDLKPGDTVLRILQYDQTKISTRAGKVGFFGPEKYEILSVQNPKYARTTFSYKIKYKDTNRVVPGNVARWELRLVPRDTIAAPPIVNAP